MSNKYLVIEDGTVTNIVMAEADFAASQGWVAHQPDVVIGSRWDGSNFLPPLPKPVRRSDTVTNLQFRKAVRASGKAAQFKTYVQSLSEEAQEEWQFATTIRRGSSMMAAAQAALGFTDEQADNLFRAARGL